MKDSFIFYRSFFEASQPLDDQQKAELFNGICEFALNQNETITDPFAKAMFILIKPQLEANNKRYENGKKGGRPKQTITKTKPKHNLDITKPKPNANKNVNVNHNVNANEKKKHLDFVFLSEEEFSKLQENITPEDTQELIEELNDYIGSTEKKYKSHYHTILSWHRKRVKERPKNLTKNGNIAYPVWNPDDYKFGPVKK